MNDYIVGIGEVLWDVFPTGKKLGGAPANFAYHVSQFGLCGLAVSAVGRDALGEETVNSLSEHGLNFHIDRVEEPTGTVQVTLDDKGVPQYEIKTGVAWDNIPYSKELSEIASETRAVCSPFRNCLPLSARPSFLGFIYLLSQRSGKFACAVIASHFQRVHTADAIIGMSALASLDFTALQLVDEIRVTDKGPCHLDCGEARSQHLFDGRTGNHATDIYQGQADRLPELSGILQEICILIWNGRNDHPSEHPDHGLEPPELPWIHVMCQRTYGHGTAHHLHRGLADETGRKDYRMHSQPFKFPGDLQAFIPLHPALETVVHVHLHDHSHVIPGNLHHPSYDHLHHPHPVLERPVQAPRAPRFHRH